LNFELSHAATPKIELNFSAKLKVEDEIEEEKMFDKTHES
jgi:hypothetical protein